MKTKQVRAKWKLLHPLFEGYVIGDDGELYKLPYESNGRSYSLRRIGVINKGGTKGYFLVHGKNKYWCSLRKLKALQDQGDIETIDNEQILVKGGDMPY